jgi:hypothetical protein
MLKHSFSYALLEIERIISQDNKHIWSCKYKGRKGYQIICPKEEEILIVMLCSTGAASRHILGFEFESEVSVDIIL